MSRRVVPWLVCVYATEAGSGEFFSWFGAVKGVLM